MSIVIGTKTSTVASFPGASNTVATISHFQDSGSDGYLLVAVFVNAMGRNFASVVYDSVPCTELFSTSASGPSARWGFFFLATPSTGTNDLVVTLDGNYGGQGVFQIISLTGCGGIGAFGNNGFTSHPHSRNLSVVADSLIYAFSIAQFPFTSIVITGGSILVPGSDLISTNYFRGAYSSGPLTAGVKTVTVNTTIFNSTNSRIELLSVTSSPPSLNVLPTTISGLTYAEGNGPSAEQTFTVSGDDLTADAIVTAPINYLISKTSGSGFASSVSLSQAGGNIVGEPVTVYVILESGLPEGTYNSEVVTISSTGATTQTIALIGNVSPGRQGNFFLMF